MENLGKVTLFAIMIAGGFLTALLGAKIIISIADLYQLSFITKMSFVQVYGLLIIVNLIRYKKANNTDENEKFEDLMKRSFKEILQRIVFILFGWGLAFFAFNILS